ncbi:hypothetical protein EQT97_04160 [Fructilactobacillus sanfranciscensis]|nr:hypothetical protein [Fructilactobacillus sanfranciscensis]
MSAITAVGSIFGSIILLFTSAETFKKVVPIIILFSGILMVLPKKHTSATEVKRGVQVMAVASLMAVGVYEG